MYMEAVSVPHPVNSWRVLPELFEPVVVPGLGAEQVHDDVAVVLHDPPGGLVALHGEALLAVGTHLRVDLLRPHVELTAAGAGDDHEEAIGGCLASHGEN